MSKMHYAWIITFTGILALLLSQGFGKMAYPVILPSMKDGLSLTYTQVGLIGTGNFIGYLVLGVVGGFLSSRFGARRVIFVSLLVMGVGLFLTGLSDSFFFAFITRLITGIGNGGSLALRLPSRSCGSWRISGVWPWGLSTWAWGSAYPYRGFCCPTASAVTDRMDGGMHGT